MKYYFQDGDESCYTLDYHYDHMEENFIKSMDVFEARREKVEGYFYCKEYSEVGEIGENFTSCGKSCEAYKPRNKISGICKHYGYLYEQTEIKKTLTI